MKSICFNLFDAQSVIFPKDKYTFGGAEVRGVTIANELAKRNIITTIVIRENNKAINTTANGIKIISHQYFSKKNPTLFQKVKYITDYFLFNEKDVTKNDFLKWRPYIKIDSEFYAAFEITNNTKNLIDYCKCFNKKFLLFIASDGELSFTNEAAKGMNVNVDLAKYIIENSNTVFVQNDYQLTKLKNYFNVKGIQINNPLPLNIENTSNTNKIRKYIVWIGKSNDVKQPQKLIEIAKQLPHEQFYMVMNKNDEAQYHHILSALPSNIIFKERLTLTEINNVLTEAKYFVNTSLFEGFPNTFLQAGYFSVPILSLHVNPNNMFDNCKVGFCCNGNLSELVEIIKNTNYKSDEYLGLSTGIKTYVTLNHSSKAVINKILQHLN